jgi:hypothetical protein
MLSFLIISSLEQESCSIQDIRNHHLDKEGLSMISSIDETENNLTVSKNVFFNLHTGDQGSAIYFFAYPSSATDSSLQILHCFFFFCGSNGGNGGVVYFIGTKIDINLTGAFDCEAIQANELVSGIFVYAEFAKYSTINQVIAIRTSPDDAHVYFQNELSGGSHYAVFSYSTQ